MIKINQKGLSLLEVAVTMGIFSFVVTLVIGMFVRSTNTQKNVEDYYLLQREGSFIMERIVREIRMAQNSADLSHDNGDPWRIQFRDHDGNMTMYCWSKAGGNCANNTANNSNISVKKGGGSATVINSSKVKVEDLRFYFADDFTSTQPIVTITLKLKGTKPGSTASLLMQSSTALRIYE